MSDYYVSRAGDDRADGLSPGNAVRSFARVGVLPLAPGDRVLLRAGDVWVETLTLRGVGDPARPITVAAFGEGARPHIRKPLSRVRDRCVLLDRARGVRLVGLELSGAWYGVEIAMDSAIRTRWAGYELTDCYLHDILGPDFPHDQSRGADLADWPWAVYKRLDAASDGCTLADVTLRGCVTDRCQGVWSTQWAEGGSGVGSVAEDNVLFDGCTFLHCYYNNIYLCNSRRSEMRRCLMAYGSPNAGNWPYGNAFVISGSPAPDKPTLGNTLVGCEFGWIGDVPGGADGCFYDLEYDQSDTRIERCFFHDAFGEAFLVMPKARVERLVIRDSVVTDVCLQCTNRDMLFDVFNLEGSALLEIDRFYLAPGLRLFRERPPGYEMRGCLAEAPASDPFCAAPALERVGNAVAVPRAEPGATVRYTLDGSLPDGDSPVFAAPVPLGRWIVLLAKAFAPGKLPSRVAVSVAPEQA